MHWPQTKEEWGATIKISRTSTGKGSDYDRFGRLPFSCPPPPEQWLFTYESPIGEAVYKTLFNAKTAYQAKKYALAWAKEHAMPVNHLLVFKKGYLPCVFANVVINYKIIDSHSPVYDTVNYSLVYHLPMEHEA